MNQSNYPTTAVYLYELIADIIHQYRAEESGTAARKHIVELGNVFSLLLSELTKTENQYFPNSYARLVFILNTYAAPPAIAEPLHRLRFWITAIAKQYNIDFDERYFYAAIAALCRAIEFLLKADIPDVLQQVYANTDTLNTLIALPPTEELVTQMHAVVLKASPAASGQNYAILNCQTEEADYAQIYLTGSYLYLAEIAWPYAYLSLTYIGKRVVNGEIVYHTTNETLITLDPDYLFDASEVKDCQQENGTIVPELYWLKKMLPAVFNIHILRGSLINEYLDRHLIDSHLETPPELINTYIRQRPFTALWLTDFEKPQLVADIQTHYDTLNRDFVQHFRHHRLTLEPTFISSQFGLRGRLDVLVEYAEDAQRKDVIELKTSKLPTNKLIWRKDEIQATCYNLLLDSMDQNRLGSSAILYSAANTQQNPLRNAPNDNRNKRETLAIRNYLAALMHQLTQQPEAVFDRLNPDNMLGKGLFESDMQAVRQLHNALQKASLTVRAYFFAFIQFAAREQRTAKVGTDGNRPNEGFSALWQLSLAEKTANYTIIAFLSYQKSAILPNNKTAFWFAKTPDKTSDASIFRLGDFVLIYPQSETGELQPMRRQLIRATITDITPTHIVLSPQTLYIDKHYFEQSPYWAIESEMSDVAFDCMYQSLYQFLLLPTAKQSLLLGQRAPSFAPLPKISIEGLHEIQNQLLCQALAAQDYFLLQGPPGTGKTKLMLKNLILQLLQNPTERLLLLAYTNRAVDEMCESLKELSEPPFFVRLGYSSATSHEDVLLSRQLPSEFDNLASIAHHLKNCRIYVSTVLTYMRHQSEMATALQFSTAIIDEASQLLEPQIVGILGNVSRFILIGDEKQLPAVVSQPLETAISSSPYLNEIGIYNLGVSLFERLLIHCQAKNWNSAFGMLRHQGRMHLDIQQFPNKTYYSDALEPAQAWQYQALSSEQTTWWASQRLLYIATPAERRRNVNLYEAKLVASLLEEIKAFWGDDFDAETVGVITPYRAQIAEIQQLLPTELRAMVSIDTVERYQGSQRKVIIISMAVNHAKQLQQLHVLNTAGTVDKKLNVAITRARRHLIMIGCENILRQSVIYNSLLEHFYQEGSVIRKD